MRFFHSVPNDGKQGLLVEERRDTFLLFAFRNRAQISVRRIRAHVHFALLLSRGHTLR